MDNAQVSNICFVLLLAFHKFTPKQECIPVGCVPPAAVAVSGGGLQQAPPGAGTPPGAGRHPPGTRNPPGSRHPTPGPPCGQNHRRLWKYNLAPTSLWVVINCLLCVNAFWSKCGKCYLFLQVDSNHGNWKHSTKHGSFRLHQSVSFSDGSGRSHGLD